MSEFRERMDKPDGLPWFFEKLDLSEDQQTRIRAIFETHRPVIDSLMGETMPRIRALRDSAETQIKEILTPEQREKFERFSPKHRFPMGDFRRPFDSGDGGPMEPPAKPGPH
jgi:Spy/CpxP family protein refolding chaperone